MYKFYDFQCNADVSNYALSFFSLKLKISLFLSSLHTSSLIACPSVKTFDLSLSLVTVENTSNLNILCSSLANVVKSVNTGFLPSVVSSSLCCNS